MASGEIEDRIVRVLDPPQAGVEPAEQEELRLPALGSQKQPGHRRAERQRVKSREDERENDRERELVVQLPGHPRHERDRHEHGREHQRDGDDRGCDLGHRGPRGLKRRQAPVQEFLDVLDHDDRVIHHQADGQDQAAEGQRVDRETERGHRRERRDQRDGDRQHRDDRRPQPLQEDEDNNHHQPERFDQRVFHLADVLVNVLRRVINDRVVESLREALLETIHLDAHLVDDGQGVGVCVLIDQDPAGRLAVNIACRLEVLRRELDPGNVPEADDRAVVVATDHDLLEFSHLLQPSLDGDRQLEILPGGNRPATDLAGRGLHVFLLDRRDHFRRRDLHVRQPVGVNPDPHRILAAEHGGVADSTDPLENVGHVDLAVIIEECGIVAAVG